MPAVQPVLADQHGELAVGLELVIGGPGADLRVSARIPPPAIGLLAGQDRAHTGELVRAGRPDLLAEQVPPGHPDQGRIAGREQRGNGVVAQAAHFIASLSQRNPARATAAAASAIPAATARSGQASAVPSQGAWRMRVT